MDAALLQVGVAGAVLLWFMLRAEKRLERLEAAVDTLARAMLLDVATRAQTDDVTRERANDLLREIDKRKADVRLASWLIG